MGHSIVGVDYGNHGPYDAGGQDYRLGFAQMGKLFRHHQQVGYTENYQGGESNRMCG